MKRILNYDAIVIGGGAVGSSVAFHLAKRGLRVCTLERGDVGDGTSGRCDGNVMASDSTPGYAAEMTYRSLMLFPDLSRQLDYDIHWSQRGSLLVFETEEEMELGRTHVEKLRESGIPAHILDRKEVHDDEPYLAADIPGGIETTCDGALDPISYVIALNLASSAMGVTIEKHCEVRSIKKQSDGTFIVSNGEMEWAAPAVVNAAGVWAGQIGRMIGLDVPIKPRQGQILVAEQTFRIARRKVMEFGYLAAKYADRPINRQVSAEMERYGVAMVYEPTHVNNFLLGSSRCEAGFDVSSNHHIMRAIAERGMRFFPVLKDIHIIRSYAGVRPYCEDHMPIVSESTIPGFYIAAGHEGNGIGLSQITGVLISQMICGDADFVIDPAPLSYARFSTT